MGFPPKFWTNPFQPLNVYIYAIADIWYSLTILWDSQSHDVDDDDDDDVNDDDDDGVSTRGFNQQNMFETFGFRHWMWRDLKPGWLAVK